MEAGVPIHPSIQRIMDRRVFLHSHLEEGWSAFWVLNNSRPFGFGVGHIQLSEILAFASLFDYEPGSLEVEELVWTVQIIDSEYITIAAEDRAREKEK